MKVRLLLVATMFMAMFALSVVPSASAAPGVTSETKIALTPESSNFFVHGVADYKVFAGGGSSFAVSVQGAQAVRFQKLYVNIEDSNDNDSTLTLACTLRIGVNGNGSCVVDSRTGAIVPTITSGEYVAVLTSTNPNDELLEGQFQ